MRRPARLLLLALIATAVEAQHLAGNPDEFTRVLREVLALAKPIDLPSAMDPLTGKRGIPIPGLFGGEKPAHTPSLPNALACDFSPEAWSCSWEAVPNMYSPAMLQDELSALAATAISPEWKRRTGQQVMTRYTEFINPTGDIAITISSTMTIDGLLPSQYGARLTIHSPKLRMY